MNYDRRFRDPIHGFIHLSARELKLVDTRAFRRLRNIKQLALTYLVYPGAMHTRFEHSLGVMELATKAFEAVANRFHEHLTASFGRLDLSLEQAKTLLRVTALLHDVGHLPFSHVGEGILPAKGDGQATRHEDVSIAIIMEDEISRILERDFYRGCTEHVCLLLDERREVPPELLILKKIMSGQFDADKMDYLSRDSLHCGVGYGNFDYLRLLETLRVKESSEGGLELCLERGGIHTLEAMMLARYWMFTQVYCHKTRRIYDFYLTRYLKSWYKNQYENLLGVLNEDDVSVMLDLRRDAAGEETERQKYAKRILNREHHRVVFETGNHADVKDKKLTIKVEMALRDHYPHVDFQRDDGASGTVHKFYRRGDEQVGEEFLIFDTISRRYSGLSEQSRIFDSTPRTFRVIRIYADVPRESVSEYRTFAAQRAKEFQEGG